MELMRSGIKSLSEMMKARRMRLAGHVLRQMEDRPANVAMNWTPKDGKRPRGRPQKTWHTTFIEDRINQMQGRPKN